MTEKIKILPQVQVAEDFCIEPCCVTLRKSAQLGIQWRSQPKNLGVQKILGD